MVKSRIFDNTQLLKEHPELPHYKEEVVCFRKKVMQMEKEGHRSRHAMH